METVLEALTNSLCLILEAISRFDIMAVDTNKIAMFYQAMYDAYRICSPAIIGVVKVVRIIAERVVIR